MSYAIRNIHSYVTDKDFHWWSGAAG